MSKNTDLLLKYAQAHGLEGVRVDDETLLLSPSGVMKIGVLDGQHELDYYMAIEEDEDGQTLFGGEEIGDVKKCHKNSQNGIDLYHGENGVFIVDTASQRLKMFVPVCECNTPTMRSGIVSIHGHGESATVILADLKSSFAEHTR